MYYLGEQIKKKVMGRAWGLEDSRNAYSVLVGET
jgi:hypothetical protein